MRDSKRTMNLLFYMIAQLYLIRISRGLLAVLGYVNIKDIDFWDVVIPCSKSVMLYGIAYSIIKSVNTSIIMEEIQQQLESNFRCYSSVSDKNNRDSLMKGIRDSIN